MTQTVVTLPTEIILVGRNISCDMENIVILTDSRGKNLEECFSTEVQTYVDIRTYSGLTLHQLNYNLPQYRFLQRASMVYIMVGVNDFTILDRATHTVRLATPFLSGLLVRLKNEINALDMSMRKFFPRLPYILCPLYGLDVNANNRMEGIYRYQDVLDAAVIKVNEVIGRLNTRNGQINPFVSNVIHRYRPKIGEYITLYHKLWDGLHPTKSTQEKIASYLLRSIHRHSEVH